MVLGTLHTLIMIRTHREQKKKNTDVFAKIRENLDVTILYFILCVNYRNSRQTLPVQPINWWSLSDFSSSETKQ